MLAQSLSVADIVAIVVGVANLIVVWWRVSASDRLTVAALEDVKERLRRIENAVFLPRS